MPKTTKITPRLYKVVACSAHDTTTEIYTDCDAASYAASEMWDQGGIYATRIYYCDESIDGELNWLISEEV
jgi:hypothetical protein